MIKAIIFDFDGVLVESVDIKTNAFTKLFEDEGRDVSQRVTDYHIKHTGISRFEKFEYIYRNILKRKLTDKIFKDLCHKFSILVTDEVITASYVKGAKEFLDHYAAQYKCFVASATPQEEMESIIIARKMSHYFIRAYGAPNKKIDIVKEVVSKNNFLQNEVVYLGDALSDYEAAIANSIHFVARINNNESLFTNISCSKIKDLSSLKEILDNLINTKKIVSENKRYAKS